MKRSEAVAEAAITLLAERGMRGLTHRAVDELAGLPPGSTSNLARTRAALLELTLHRLTELEENAFAPATGDARAVLGNGASAGPFGTEGMELGDLADLLAEVLAVQLGDRRRTLARYELALEATRRPELREIYDRVGARFRDPAAALLAAAGSADPVRHGRQLVAYGEGIMFDAIAGAGVTPTIDDLRAGLREFLSGMLR
ncbi:TetR/AcrR family transcriptional regulator [Nonomuraea africana]|uniref:TetR/AcrR family transcriptional regulator n=1 Tax=Nonomuraea africana TaxID=46171 RepID=UPI0033CD9D29